MHVVREYNPGVDVEGGLGAGQADGGAEVGDVGDQEVGCSVEEVGGEEVGAAGDAVATVVWHNVGWGWIWI